MLELLLPEELPPPPRFPPFPLPFCLDFFLRWSCAIIAMRLRSGGPPLPPPPPLLEDLERPPLERLLLERFDAFFSPRRRVLFYASFRAREAKAPPGTLLYELRERHSLSSLCTRAPGM